MFVLRVPSLKQKEPGRQTPEQAVAEPSQGISRLAARTHQALSAVLAPGSSGNDSPSCHPGHLSSTGQEGDATLILVLPCFDFQATTSTNWILESQNINELKSEINSLKGLLLNR